MPENGPAHNLSGTASDQPRNVALLHSISLPAGHRLVMADLKEMAQTMGLGNPQTRHATGNLVFSSPADPGVLEQQLEAAYQHRFGRQVDILVRRASDWQRLAAQNPFGTVAETEPSRVIVRVMRQPMLPDALQNLTERARDGEQLALVDGDLWIAFAGPPGLSRLASRLSRRHLGIGTMRNWNTVRALNAMIAD